MIVWKTLSTWVKRGILDNVVGVVKTNEKF